ncbi:MAG TPA: alpha/beta hydrolase [Saprospiraceae bacterium]|nr:alpha/beta hydrolase [Saprospiraceae bacterium]
MKRNFFSLTFLLLLFYLCACNNSYTGAAKQNESRAIPEVKAVFINGDSIHYIDVGKGDAVVFVHGAFGDYRTWEAQMDTFAQHHRVISYSRRLCYPNNQIANDSTDVSTIGHARDLAELLKALNLGPVHLVGHSGGGSIALFTTIEHPELVRSLTLAEAVLQSLLKNVPQGDSVLNSLYTKAIKPSTEAFKSNNDEKGVIAFINGVMGDSSYFNNLSQQLQKKMMTNIPEVKQNLLYGSPSPEVTCDDVGKIKVPVLVVTGRKSISFFSLMNNELYRCLSNRERATLINAAHGLEYENPSDFNKIVLEFLDKHK